MNKTIKFIMLFLVIIFLALYYADKIGYYDVIEHKKSLLTEEKIEEFESDLKNGVNLDNKKYLQDIETDYRNNLTTACNNVNNKISTYFKETINGVFNILGRLLNG